MTAVPSAGAPCPLCESPLAPAVLARAEGFEAGVRLRLARLPVLACPVPHRYFAGHGFPMWLLNDLVDAKLPEVPAGRERGLVFRRYACGGCGAKLPRGGEPRSFSWTLAWKDGPPFEATLQVPVVPCAACGREQARSAQELAKLVPAALVHAFKAGAIKAPG